MIKRLKKHAWWVVLFCLAAFAFQVVWRWGH